jgi:hypothetical protein
MAPFVVSLQKQDAEKRILNGKWQMENGKPNIFLPFLIFPQAVFISGLQRPFATSADGLPGRGPGTAGRRGLA